MKRSCFLTVQNPSECVLKTFPCRRRGRRNLYKHMLLKAYLWITCIVVLPSVFVCVRGVCVSRYSLQPVFFKHLRLNKAHGFGVAVRQFFPTLPRRCTITRRIKSVKLVKKQQEGKRKKKLFFFLSLFIFTPTTSRPRLLCSGTILTVILLPAGDFFYVSLYF